jgi:hypothetical protein
MKTAGHERLREKPAWLAANLLTNIMVKAMRRGRARTVNNNIVAATGGDGGAGDCGNRTLIGAAAAAGNLRRRRPSGSGMAKWKTGISHPSQLGAT